MVSRSQFAELVGVNEGVIRRAIKRGRISADPAGTINADTEVERWHATKKPRRGGRLHERQESKP
jgi:hypothetical protein